MQTSKKALLATTLLGVLGALSGHCAASSTCDQYTDCAQGFTCADGMCVLPPNSVDASAADSTADAGAVDALPHDSSGLVDTASSDAGHAAGEAAADASSADVTGDGATPDGTSLDANAGG
jgi:hypothetical protein